MSETPTNAPQGRQEPGRKPDDAAIVNGTRLYGAIFAAVLAAGSGIAAIALSRSEANETPTSYTSNDR